jgi:hypothetical protein
VNSDPIEELLLRAYPNPERKGCPGSETIRALANKEYAHGHPAWEHIWKCSPCFAEFRELRDARLASERSARRRRIAYLSGVAAILLLCLGGGLGLFFSNRRQNVPAPQQVVRKQSPPATVYPAAVLNLESTLRSGESGAVRGTQTGMQVLPRRALELTVYLPRGSEEGDYEFELLDSHNAVLVSATGRAEIDRGLTRFTTVVDLAKLLPGTYSARSRRLPAGGWHSSTVTME